MSENSEADFGPQDLSKAEITERFFRWDIHPAFPYGKGSEARVAFILRSETTNDSCTIDLDRDALEKLLRQASAVISSRFRPDKTGAIRAQRALEMAKQTLDTLHK